MRYLRSLRKGERFKCGYGDTWIKERPHGAHDDVFFATRERDGFESCFGGNLVIEKDVQ